MIEFQSLSKRYPGPDGESVFALQDVDWRVKSGEFVMVVGPSGSGKSTLLVTAGGMLAPTEGKILFEGRDVYALSPGKRAALRRKRVGFVFQTFNLIPYLNCLENVALPALIDGKPGRASFDRAKSLLDDLGMGRRLLHKPSELSVGERQRTAICRSLINRPDVILADEPTGNLDSGNTDDVLEIFGRLNSEGQTIVMATHDLRLAEKGTRIVSLLDGRIEHEKNVLGRAAPCRE